MTIENFNILNFAQSNMSLNPRIKIFNCLFSHINYFTSARIVSLQLEIFFGLSMSQARKWVGRAKVNSREDASNGAAVKIFHTATIRYKRVDSNF
jgi:hypothetical protein